jgi:hypothetical protein
MLRQAQHERTFINKFKVNSVRPEPSRRVNGGFSAPWQSVNKPFVIQLLHPMEVP